MLSLLELSLALCKTYPQFIICRALFGLAMGGIYGNASITALEDCPEAARGLAAGLFQSGYPMGFLLVTAFWSAFDTNREGDWKHLFYFAACPPLFLIIFRFFLPETEFFEHEVKPGNGTGSTLQYVLAVREAMKRHWKRILYLVVFMVGCSLMVNSSLDLCHWQPNLILTIFLDTWQPGRVHSLAKEPIQIFLQIGHKNSDYSIYRSDLRIMGDSICWSSYGTSFLNNHRVPFWSYFHWPVLLRLRSCVIPNCVFSTVFHPRHFRNRPNLSDGTLTSCFQNTRCRYFIQLGSSVRFLGSGGGDIGRRTATGFRWQNCPAIPLQQGDGSILRCDLQLRLDCDAPRPRKPGAEAESI